VPGFSGGYTPLARHVALRVIIEKQACRAKLLSEPRADMRPLFIFISFHIGFSTVVHDTILLLEWICQSELGVLVMSIDAGGMAKAITHEAESSSWVAWCIEWS